MARVSLSGGREGQGAGANGRGKRHVCVCVVCVKKINVAQQPDEY